MDTIDRFRDHVRAAAAAERRSIQRRSAKLPAEAREMLAEDLNELDVISDFADQLAIVALYRVVELNRKRILRSRFPQAPAKTASYIDQLREYLKQQGIAPERVPHYRAMEELRLLNNAIKHDGHIDAKLAKKFSRWKQGAKLAGLGADYERLKGRVASRIFRFAERVKV